MSQETHRDPEQACPSTRFSAEETKNAWPKSPNQGVTTKIGAMKQFREATGVGLGTAKSIVDDYEFGNPRTFK